MKSPGAWLTLAAPSLKTIKFSLKGPLYAASAVLARRAEAAVSVVEARGEATVGVAFVKTKSFSYGITSHSEATRFQQREPGHEWAREGARLILDDCDTPITTSAMEVLPAPELMFSVQEALKANVATSFGSVFPTGRRLQGLYLEQKTTSLFAGYLAKLNEVSESAYLAAHWPTSPQFELDWRDGEVTALRFKIAMFGSVELKHEA